ncbi:MAG: hypothetical protein FWG10_13295 [Eubacteriaceae bacterium]|nr:hypothetical protein [Eubacteriaceae bacterium]
MAKHEQLAVKRQCELLGVGRSSFYYEPREPSKEELELEEHIKKRIGYWHTKHCWMGARKLAGKPVADGGIEGVGRQLVKRHMQEMGIFAVYPKPRTSIPTKG